MCEWKYLNFIARVVVIGYYPVFRWKRIVWVEVAGFNRLCAVCDGFMVSAETIEFCWFYAISKRKLIVWVKVSGFYVVLEQLYSLNCSNWILLIFSQLLSANF